MTGVEIALLAATAVSAVGSIQAGNAAAAQAEAAANAAEFNVAVAERNQDIAAQKRLLSIRQAQVDAADKRRENRRRLSEIRANYGASGLDLAGSPLDVLEDTALELETDARRIEHQGQVAGFEGALQILGLQDEATLSTLEAASARSRASSERTAGYLNAAGTAIGGTATAVGAGANKTGWG